jgi:hypothetical protein
MQKPPPVIGQRHPIKQKGHRIRMQKPLVKLENWAVVRSLTMSFQELKPGSLLVGKVFGHPKIKEASFIFTSPIVSIDTNKRVVETRNTAYCLGEASDEYRTWEQTRGAAA